MKIYFLDEHIRFNLSVIVEQKLFEISLVLINLRIKYNHFCDGMGLK